MYNHCCSRQSSSYSPRPRGRYKWRFGFQLALAYLAFSIGMQPIVSVVPDNYNRIEPGAFFLVHVLIMMLVGLPLSYLLSMIGQFSGLGTLQVWKMVPAAWGIGLAIVVTMVIMAVVNAVTVAYAFYYFKSYSGCLV